MKHVRKIRGFSRRRFLRLSGGAALGGALGGLLDALLIEPRWVRVSRPTVPIARLPDRFDGLRIAHLTDLHHGRLARLGFLKEVVRLTNAESPDLIVVTGDFVSRRKAITEAYSAVLGDLSAPLGVFAVLGNHDHWTDGGAVRGMLRRAGIQPVDNTHVLLHRGADRLAIAGVGDLWADRQDLSAALAGVPDGAARVLLCHNPDYAHRMPSRPRVDLMLAGHTHGGQVKIPFARRPRLPLVKRLYAAGMVPGPHCPVYVSVGIGMVGLPLRFNCRPELPIVTLRRAQA